MAEAERRWYVIHTYSGYEQRVLTNLEQRIRSMDAQDKIFKVTIPTENEIEIGEARILLDSGFKKSYRTVVLMVFDHRFRVGDRICMDRCA